LGLAIIPVIAKLSEGWSPRMIKDLPQSPLRSNIERSTKIYEQTHDIVVLAKGCFHWVQVLLVLDV
jgi:hypothetical protein